MNLLHVKTNTVADFTGTVTVYNQTGGSQTMAATDLVRPSDWNSQHKMLLTFEGNTTGNSTISGTAIPIAGAGGVTVGGSNGSFVISGMTDPGWLTTAAQSNQVVNSLNGSTGQLSIYAGSGVSVENFLSGITVRLRSDITTALQSTGNYLTTARASNDAVGLNTALTAGPLAWTVNSNGLSLNAGSAAGTTSGFAGNLISGSMTHNTAGLNLSLNHPAWLTTAAQSNHSHNLATTTTNGAVIVVATTNSAGATLAVPPFLTTAAQSDHSHGNPTLALTNLTGTTASNSAGFTLSLSGAGGGVINQTGPNIADSAATITSGTVVFSNANGVSFGLAGSTMTASHNALTTAALSNHSHGNPTLNLTNLSGTTGSNSNGFTLSLSAAAPGGGGGHTVSSWQNFPNIAIYGSFQIRGVGNSGYIVPMDIPCYLTASFLQFLVTNSIASTSYASTANTTFSYNQQHGLWFVLYTKGTGASSDSLFSITSTSISERFSYNAFYGSASNTQQGYSFGITWYNSAGSQTASTNFTTSNLSTGAISTNVLSNFSGVKFYQIPWGTSFTPGQYYLAFHISSSSTTQGINLSGARMNSSTMAATQVNSALQGYFGSASNTRIKVRPFLGSVSTAGSTTVSVIPSSAVSTQGSNVIPYLSWMLDMPSST